MNRRDFIRTALAASAGLALRGRPSMAQHNPEPKPPNLLFVFADQMRRHAMGFLNQDPVVTPTLDRLAADGVVLDHAVSTVPICSPFRGMLLTGRWPFSTEVLFNCYARPDGWELTDRERSCFLKRSERCFSEVLNDAGYSTGYIGKYHLTTPRKPYLDPTDYNGYIWDGYPPPEDRHGFHFWYGYGCNGNHLNPHYYTGDLPKDQPIQVNRWSPEHEADIAIDYITDTTGKYRDPDKPFALFLSHNPPHNPYNAVPDKYLEPYRDIPLERLLSRPNVDLSRDDRATAQAARSARGYFAMVTGLDDQLGRILACLKQQGIEDDTIVVFTADHGDMMGSHQRMAKSVWYEESIGIPFIVRCPRRLKPRRDDLLLSVPDYMPTLLGLMGLSASIPDSVEGADYSQALLGESSARPDAAPYMRIHNRDDRTGARGLRTHTHTFVVQRTDQGEHTLLYDNVKDPYQLRNVAGDNPSLIDHFTSQLHAWLERMGDPWERA